jgi:ASC-1-like (ASCH) protein
MNKIIPVEAIRLHTDAANQVKTHDAITVFNNAVKAAATEGKNYCSIENIHMNRIRQEIIDAGYTVTDGGLRDTTTNISW